MTRSHTNLKICWRYARWALAPAALAALTAAEHAVLMVASVLPEGQRRMRELGAQAPAAAEERLALFKDLGQ